MLQLIAEYPVVVGCMAWLTDFDVLEAMSKMELVFIVVQKEDFLRPDSATAAGHLKEDFPMRLRKAYEALPNLTFGFQIEGLVGELSIEGNGGLDSVRCVGNHNASNIPGFPRMHNKFLVFTLSSESTDYGHQRKEYGVPFSVFVTEDSCVWTGSYNISKTATRSFENALILRGNRAIAQAYFDEWSQIMALSEPLDWESEWVAPEYHIRT